MNRKDPRDPIKLKIFESPDGLERIGDYWFCDSLVE